MKTHKFIFSAAVICLLTPASFAGVPKEKRTPAPDHSAWLQHQSKDLGTLLSQFEPACERRFLPEIIKAKKTYDVADTWNKKHCQCVSRYLAEQKNIQFVQWVNLYLRDQLRSLPPAPRSLSLYTQRFQNRRLECQFNPDKFQARPTPERRVASAPAMKIKLKRLPARKAASVKAKPNSMKPTFRKGKQKTKTKRKGLGQRD